MDSEPLSDSEYRIQENRFVQELVKELFDKMKEYQETLPLTQADTLRLVGYLVQSIVNVLVSPAWDIRQEQALLPSEEKLCVVAGALWQIITLRTVGFCLNTECKNSTYEKTQADWVLLRLKKEIFLSIESPVMTVRVQQAPHRV